MTPLTPATALHHQVKQLRGSSIRRAVAAAAKRVVLLPGCLQVQLEYAVLLYFDGRYGDAWLELGSYVEALVQQQQQQQQQQEQHDQQEQKQQQEGQRQQEQRQEQRQREEQQQVKIVSTQDGRNLSSVGEVQEPDWPAPLAATSEEQERQQAEGQGDGSGQEQQQKQRQRKEQQQTLVTQWLQHREEEELAGMLVGDADNTHPEPKQLAVPGDTSIQVDPGEAAVAAAAAQGVDIDENPPDSSTTGSWRPRKGLTLRKGPAGAAVAGFSKAGLAGAVVQGMGGAAGAGLAGAGEGGKGEGLSRPVVDEHVLVLLEKLRLELMLSADR